MKSRYRSLIARIRFLPKKTRLRENIMMNESDAENSMFGIEEM